MVTLVGNADEAAVLGAECKSSRESTVKSGPSPANSMCQGNADRRNGCFYGDPPQKRTGKNSPTPVIQEHMRVGLDLAESCLFASEKVAAKSGQPGTDPTQTNSRSSVLHSSGQSAFSWSRLTPEALPGPIATVAVG